MTSCSLDSRSWGGAGRRFSSVCLSISARTRACRLGAQWGRWRRDPCRRRGRSLSLFPRRSAQQAPPAAVIAEVEVEEAEPAGFAGFAIRESERRDKPTVRISPDLPVCDACLARALRSGRSAYQYPYINCTNCGPRYTVILALPYDRPNTTMKPWPLDEYCDGGISRSGEPAISRPTRRLPTVRAALRTALMATNHSRRCRSDSQDGRASAAREDHRDEGTGRISPGMRRPQCHGSERAARAEVSQRETIRRDGEGP